MARAKADSGEGVNKMALVREALQELGADAKPRAIGEYVKSKHGIEMAVTMISSYKSNINNKGGGRSTAGRVGRGASADGNVSLADLEQVQRLIERVGVPQLQHLIKVLAK